MKRLLTIAMLLATPLFVLGGCRSDAATGALIGAGAGAAGGYIIGNEMDKDDYDDHHHHRYR
jgi:hypothetical protein